MSGQLTQDGLLRAKLHDMLSPAQDLPEFSGWAIEAMTAQHLAEHILQTKPRFVLELGSGLSSLVIAYALRKAGGGKLMTVEHDAAYYAQHYLMLQAHGLQNMVEMKHCPVGPVLLEGAPRPWYRLPYDELPDEGIDLLFIDGPPKRLYPLSRYPAVPKLWPKLAQGASIWLDDAARPDERECVQRWMNQFPLSHAFTASRKGLSILRRIDKSA